MKFLQSIFFIILLISISCRQQPSENVPVKMEKDGMFIHISHGTDDPHRVLMALQMASIMAEEKEVLVYFDINGIEVVLKNSENLSYTHFPNSHTQIKNLLSKNVLLMACPGCLKAAGKEPADLMDGIQVADKNKFFNFTKGRIITLDY